MTLPQAGAISSGIGTLTRFGYEGGMDLYKATGCSSPMALEYSEISVIDGEECKKIVGGQIPDYTLCAGYYGKDAFEVGLNARFAF